MGDATANPGEPTLEPEVQEMVEAALDRTLADPQIKANFEELSAAGREVSADEVRAAILESQDQLIEADDTLLEGWREAVRRREEWTFKWWHLIKSPIVWILALAGLALLSPLDSPGISSDTQRIVSALILSGVGAFAYVRLLLDFGEAGSLEEVKGEVRELLETTLGAQTVIAVRAEINRRLASVETDFEMYGRRGLRQLVDPNREVSTQAVNDLKDLIVSLDSGSIGLSGPRGCGKTTVIKSFAEGRTMAFPKELIGLTVAAPVKYDAKEFVLHLFASLCERVGREGADDTSHPGNRWQQAQTRRKLAFWALTTTALLVAGVLLVWDPGPVSIEKKIVAVMLISLALGCMGATFGFWTETPSGLSFVNWVRGRLGLTQAEAMPRSAIESTARAYLRQIRYQQSHSAEGSAGFSLFGFDLGGSSSMTLSRNPWTLPEAVDEFRRFASLLSDRYVVIGIDELDKMESDEAAREFLNNVKGVFGVVGCYFLVSVSEDAMSAFERRGLPLRDVFDSSFDEIQQVDYLRLDESRRMLDGRVIGLPVPFQCLCHCLSGGLPRDLIRVTRELDQHFSRIEKEKRKAGQEDPTVSLRELVESLVEAEWRGKLAGAIAAGRSVEHGQPLWLSEWLAKQIEGGLDRESLRERTLEIGSGSLLLEPHPGGDGEEDGDAIKARRIGVEMATFNYFADTVLGFFGKAGQSTFKDPASKGEPNTAAEEVVETLAKARQQFAIEPWLAWGLVAKARERAGMTPWKDLRPSANSNGSRNPIGWVGTTLGIGSG